MSVLSGFIPSQRHLFDMPDEVSYFNCAYMSPSLKTVRAAGESGVARKSRPWTIKASDFFEEADRTRELFASLIGAQARDVALAPSVSYGIGTAAINLPVGPGQNILVLADQFPSNYYPWWELARLRNASITVVPRPIDGNWAEAFINCVNDRTAIVAVSNCHWTDGTLVDLDTVSAWCRNHEVPLVLDVTQSLGARPLDVTRLDPAFLACASYKWLLGPYSLAFLYVAPRYQQGIPLEYGWITRERSEDFSALVNYNPNLLADARRFDMGERSNFALLPMACAALEQIQSWGVASIEETLGELTDTIEAKARALGFLVVDRAFRSRHLMGIRAPGGLPAGLGESLADRNIFVSIRGDAIRISPHLYNEERDVNRLFAALAEAVRA